MIGPVIDFEFMRINIKKLNKDNLDDGISYITENLDDDNEYEPSPDTEKYKEWELKERFLNEMVELNKEVGNRDKGQKK